MGAREISLSGPFFDTSFVSSLYSFHTRFAAIGAPPPDREQCNLRWGCGRQGKGRDSARVGAPAGHPWRLRGVARG